MAAEANGVYGIPTARCFIACREVVYDSDGQNVSLIHLIRNVTCRPDESFPLTRDQFVLYLELTNGRGVHEFTLRRTRFHNARELESGSIGPARYDLGMDTTAVRGLTIELNGIQFPGPGLYVFRLLHANGHEIAREDIMVR